jgi:hypothetical protein
MTAEEKLLHLFHLKHGSLSRSCSLEVTFDHNSDPVGVDVIKDGSARWDETRESLLYHYVTRDLDYQEYHSNE